jgi:DNA-binding beta-propeller fold protein YncE
MAPNGSFLHDGIASRVGIICSLMLVLALSLSWCPPSVFGETPRTPEMGMGPPQWEGIYDYRGTVNLRWFRVQGAVHYVIQRKVGEDGQFRELARVTNPLYDDLAVFPGKIVFYRIVPYGSNGLAGPVSEVRYLKVASFAVDEPVPPRWSSSMLMKEGIALSWAHEKSADVLAYNIYRRRTATQPFTLMVSSQDTTFLDRDVTIGTTYEYAISALYRNLQESDNSESLKITFTPPVVSLRAGRPQKAYSLEEVITPTRLLRSFTCERFGFLSPVDVDWWPEKRFLYVSDTGTGSITVINERDEVVLRLGGKGSAPWNFQNLMGICVDKAGFIYGADSYRGEIVIFRPDGGFHKRIRLFEQVRDYFGRDFTVRFPAFRFGLADLVVAPDGSLLVVDNPNGWIYVLDRQERLSLIIGGKGEAVGQMHYPTFLCLDESFRITVSDTLNSRLQVLTVMGAPEKVLGVKGMGVGQLIRPKGVARDDRGQLFVADSFLNAVQVFDAQGGFIGVLGDEEGKQLLDLGMPNGLAFLGGDLLAICEKISRRVTVRQMILNTRSLFISTPSERKQK